MTRLQKIRQVQIKAQAGCCYYCEQPMWLKDADGFAEKHRLSAGRAAFLRATAEHLVARSDGGEDTKANVVAACHYCNAHRHRAQRALAPEEYAARVRLRLANGRWHGMRLKP